MPVSQRASPFNFCQPYEESESFGIDDIVAYLKEAPALIDLDQIDNICRDPKNGKETSGSKSLIHATE